MPLTPVAFDNNYACMGLIIISKHVHLLSSASIYIMAIVICIATCIINCDCLSENQHSLHF